MHRRAFRLLSRPLAIAVLVALGLVATSGAFLPAGLDERLGAILDGPEAGPAFWGIAVLDVATGEVLYSRNADKPLLPASNQKVLTSATALDALGSSYRYQTTLYFDGDVAGATLRGDLVIDGSGDPTFGSIEARRGDPLRQWARQLAAMGVTRIEGRIIGDDDAFDDRPYAEGWDIDYVMTQSSRLLGVSTGGLSYYDNVAEIQIRANGAGAVPEVTMRPSNYLTLKADLSASGRSRGIAVRTGRTLGSEVVVLEGSLPRTYAGTIVVPVTNPTIFALHSFRQYLQEAGITVAAEVYDVDDLDEPPRLARAEPLFVYLSPPLSEILKIVNKESNNFYADQVFRTFAWGGSGEGGERRVKELLARAGAATDGLSIRDGSGLSRKDLVTPEAMARLLVHMSRHPEREAFAASLARGGEARSTLRGRLAGVPVMAKTGSLEYVRSLSGYATTTEGRTVAFAVFANNFTAPAYRINQTIDRLVMELAGVTPPPETARQNAARGRRR